MQRLHPRQLSPSSSSITTSSSTLSLTPSPTSISTAPALSPNITTQTPQPSDTKSPSAAEVAIPVLGAVAGTILIFLCLALFITYQVKAVVRFREAQILAKAEAEANNNNNDDRDSSNSSDPTEYLEEKGGPPGQSGAIQFTDDSQALLYRPFLSSPITPSAPPAPPGYTRSPQSIVIGIDEIEKKASAGGGVDSGFPAGWKTEPWQQPKSRSPQDHLKQEQLERVMKLHRQQMEELQALLQRHMLDNTQLLSPHTVVVVDVEDSVGGYEGNSRGKRGIWRVGQGWKGRWSSFRSRRRNSRRRSSSPLVRTQGQSPQGIDSPMVQPDDVVRGPEAIPYPPPPPLLDTSHHVLRRPSHMTDASSSRGSDWSFEASPSSPSSDKSVMISEELRPEERSVLVDCFEKINAHYDRQFRIAESEILQGSSSGSDDGHDGDDGVDRIESAESEK